MHDRIDRQDATMPCERLRVCVRGAVQGVGFRPFIYKLAGELKLNGWVNNSPQGVAIEVEGQSSVLRDFLQRVADEKPPRSFIQSLEHSFLPLNGYSGFAIRDSDQGGAKRTVVLPDISTCPECLEDVFDPQNRRFQYPFTNCTNCGPRFSIIESLPYDRVNTSMRRFEMCDECRAEYEDPANRRFHAQPNACPACGPHLELCESRSRVAARGHDALIVGANAIRAGKIVAVKGLGGFHLVVDAANTQAVNELRARKHREEKPFALMFPNLSAVAAFCDVSEPDRRMLTSPESPIVILKKRSSKTPLSPFVAPGNPYLGVMLPYTPLHHLLLGELGFPVVATSGNLSDEPICIDNDEAFDRLGQIADLFLIHDRPIVRHVDDSIVRLMMGREMVVRRARGFAPLPVTLDKGADSTLAVGAHLKNSVAIANGNDVFISQHIGDLETSEAFAAFRHTIDSLEGLYEVDPEVTVCDKHPRYLSSQWADGSGERLVRIQHHVAHVASCMAENDLRPPVLGIAWDGTGFGDDGTIWGGEFLRIGDDGYERAAHLRTFSLPGGDLAAKEPRRAAIGVLFEIFGPEAFAMPEITEVLGFSQAEIRVVGSMLKKSLNVVRTSSAGRLFDAVAAITGLRNVAAFEGQAAMELEFIASENVREHYEFELRAIDRSIEVDWEKMIRRIIDDIANGTPRPVTAAKFHNTLAEMMVAVAQAVGEQNVALSGGCFQNRYLTEMAITRLRGEGFSVFWHQRVPTNDGGIALGQIAATAFGCEYAASGKV